MPAPIGAGAVPLVVGAAVAEELLFRRLDGLLAPQGAALAVGASAFAFALIHVPLYGPAAFPAILSARGCCSWQRWASGDWAAPAATHALANLLVVREARRRGNSSSPALVGATALTACSTAPSTLRIVAARLQGDQPGACHAR